MEHAEMALRASSAVQCGAAFRYWQGPRIARHQRAGAFLTLHPGYDPLPVPMAGDKHAPRAKEPIACAIAALRRLRRACRDVDRVLLENPARARPEARPERQQRANCRS